eukprot:6967642-Prymnesium_polylepis.1
MWGKKRVSGACTITVSMPRRSSGPPPTSPCECTVRVAVRLDGLQSSECCAGMLLCSGAQPGAS